MTARRVGSAHKPDDLRTIVENHGLAKHCPFCGHVGMTIADYQESGSGLMVAWCCPQCGLGKKQPPRGTRFDSAEAEDRFP